MPTSRSKTSLRDYIIHRGKLEGSALAKHGGPWFAEVDQLQLDIAQSGGHWRSFSHYDYLDLASDQRVIDAAQKALAAFGPGVGASRLVGGERSTQRIFENELAEFVGMEAALTLISGYLTNYSIIPHLLGRRDLIIYDELCHNSLLMGIQASGAQAIAIPHNDTAAFEKALSENRDGHRKCLIVIEGLYSMDGDIPDLAEIIRLKKSFDCWLMVDEAHSIGVLGKTGRGISEHSGTDPKDIDLLIGTLSKTFVSAGGFIAADSDIIWYLRYTLGGFVYSVGPPPSSTASAHAALAILRDEPDRVDRLRDNSNSFLNLCHAAGLDTGNAAGNAVIPVYLPDYQSAFALADQLLAKGIYVPPVIHVGVPKSRPRLRFFISAAHSAEDFQAFIDVAEQTMRRAAE